MRALWREVVSLAVGLVGIVLLGVAMNNLLNTGSCASGGPYVTSRTCSDDDLFWGLMLPVGMLVWIGGMAISHGGLTKPGAGQLLWTLSFGGIGLAVLIKALAQDDIPGDAKLGAFIIAGVFIPMGFVVGIGGVRQLIRGRDERRRGRQPADAPESAWNRLLALRSTGAVTGAEFDRIQPDLETPGVEILLTALERLAGERDSGEITQTEFYTQKQAALSR